jgi:hypothetical protein
VNHIRKGEAHVEAAETGQSSLAGIRGREAVSVSGFRGREDRRY